jgi:sigma-B regulation protein RsbU (phosphoserine phosphatase)
MPEMDGLSLLGKLSEQNPILKTIIISAYGDMENIRTAMHRGAFDFITKPINFADLETTLYRAIRYAAWLRDVIRTENELKIARELQISLLPTASPNLVGFDLFGLCNPAQEVGGDYFDFFNLNETKIGIAIADVSGKGIPAAFYMTLLKGVLQSHANPFTSPKEALARVNRLIYPNIKRGSFISAIYAVLDTEKRELNYARAGHLEPMVFFADEKPFRDTSKGIALGLNDGKPFSETLSESKIILEKDDMVLFYTDGFNEAKNQRGEELGINRLKELAYKHSLKPSAKEIALEIQKEVSVFIGNQKQHDDMTLVALKA